MTGATGFIGSHLLRSLLSDGAAIKALVRNGGKGRHLPVEVERCIGNLGDQTLSVAIADDVDVVFHLGAAMGGPWEEHERITVEGTRRLLELCARAGVRRFVHVSSIMAHETADLRSGSTVTPDAKLASSDTALGNYARGKAEAERVVLDFCAKQSMEYVIVRPGLVYGPGHVVFEHLGKNVGGVFVGFGSRDLLLPLVSIESVVDALIRLAVTPEAAGRTYIVVDENVPRSAYIKMLGEQQDTRYRHVTLPLITMQGAAAALRAVRQTTGFKKIPDTTPEKIRSRGLSLRYDCRQLRVDTGWRPRFTLGEGLRRAVRSNTLERCGVIRVGIIGTGNVACMHVQSLRRVPNTTLAGVFDIVPGLADNFARTNGLSAGYGELEAFYSEVQPDVVHLLAPPATHAQAAIAAMERGVHVFCEKPLACSVEECRQMIDAARSNGVLLGVNHNYLFDPRVAKARAMLENGSIGELRHVEIFWGFDVRRLKHFSAEPDARTHWAYGLPGGLLEDLAPHPVSIAVAMLGNEARLAYSSVIGTGRIAEGIDEELRLALEGPTATASLGLSLTARPDDFTITMFGTEATVRIDFQDMMIQRLKLGKGPKVIARGVKVASASVQAMLQLALNPVRLTAGRALPPGDPLPVMRSFYSSLQSGTRQDATAEEGMKVVELIRAIWPCRR